MVVYEDATGCQIEAYDGCRWTSCSHQGGGLAALLSPFVLSCVLWSSGFFIYQRFCPWSILPKIIKIFLSWAGFLSTDNCATGRCPAKIILENFDTFWRDGPGAEFLCACLLFHDNLIGQNFDPSQILGLRIFWAHLLIINSCQNMSGGQS